MPESTAEKFWDTLCTSRLFGFNLILVDLVLLVLLGYSFLYIEAGTATYVIALVTLVIVLVNLVGMSILFVACNRRKKKLESH